MVKLATRRRQVKQLWQRQNSSTSSTDDDDSDEDIRNAKDNRGREKIKRIPLIISRCRSKGLTFNLTTSLYEISNSDEKAEELDTIATEGSLPSAKQISSDDSSLNSSSWGSLLTNADKNDNSTKESILLDEDSKGRASFTERLSKLAGHRFSTDYLNLVKEIDTDKYMASREMTGTQEILNAVTILLAPVLCFYFMSNGLWIRQSMIDEARAALTGASSNYYNTEAAGVGGYINEMLGDEYGCLNNASSNYSAFFSFWWKWPFGMPALPPLNIMAIFFGTLAHAPFSFIYHFKYARELPPGAARTTHWSRRIDHAMIHFAAAFFSFGSSGSLDYFAANVLFNVDCIYRQLQTEVHPQRNKARVFVAVVAYTLPFIFDDIALFCQLWVVLGISFWFFVSYPVGGWSHSIFHVFVSFAPPLIMLGGCNLPTSQSQMQLAAQCIAKAEIAGATGL